MVINSKTSDSIFFPVQPIQIVIMSTLQEVLQNAEKMLEKRKKTMHGVSLEEIYKAYRLRKMGLTILEIAELLKINRLKVRRYLALDKSKNANYEGNKLRLEKAIALFENQSNEET